MDVVEVSVFLWRRNSERGIIAHASLYIGQFATGGGDVGSDCGGYEYSVWGYPADDAYTGYHIPECLLLFIDNVYRSSLYFLFIICCPALFVLWAIVRRLSGFCCSLLHLIFCSICSVSWCWIGGVAGAAIATVFSQGVSAVLCYGYMMRRFDILRGTPDERKFNGALARRLMYIGVPMGLQFSITAIGSIMLQSANNALGTACVAAFTAAMRIKMFFMCPLESLGIAMATYTGQNYGAGKPERIWMGVKVSALMMIIYWAFTFCVLMLGARTFALLFVEASELEILKDTELFLHISVSFFPVLGLLCILRYTIQGAGYTNLAMLSGVSEMIARVLVSLYAVPAFGYLAVCFGDPTAWIAAVLFLVPAFIFVYRRLLRMRREQRV